jgi:hypothetical protein
MIPMQGSQRRVHGQEIESRFRLAVSLASSGIDIYFNAI